MPYVKPEEVLSPRSKVLGVVEVIHNPHEGGMAVARIRWKTEQGQEEDRIAIRWNGDDERPLGNPISTRQPTWFVVDRYAEAAVEKAAREAAEKSPNSLIAQYREMANDQSREQEAEEWIEGLIADASPQR